MQLLTKALAFASLGLLPLIQGCLPDETECHYNEVIINNIAASEWKALSAEFVVYDTISNFYLDTTYFDGKWKFYPDKSNLYRGRLNVENASYHNGSYNYKLNDCSFIQIEVIQADTSLDGTVYGNINHLFELDDDTLKISMRNTYKIYTQKIPGGWRYMNIKLIRQ